MRGIVCATVLGILFLVACSSDTSEPLSGSDPEAALVLPERGCAPGEPAGSIPAQICALLPTPMDRVQVTRFQAIQADFDAGHVEEAQSDMLGLIDFIAKMNRLGEVEDPNGTQPPTIPRALSDLSQALLDAVGFPGAEIPPDAYDKGFVGVVNGDEGGTAVAKNAFYGVQIPAGSFTGDALVVLDPLPNGADPLLTDEIQVPKFVEIQSIPAIESFDQPLTVGVCAITDGLTDAQSDALRLAHNVGEGVEVVDFVEPPVDLDCEALIDEEAPHALPGGPLSSGPRLAATKSKGVGGQVSSFSPFGAVVPGETPETGSIQVLTVTTGDEPDPNGYLVQLDEGEPLFIDLNDSQTFAGVSPGGHLVTLGGLSENCSVGGLNPRLVTVEAGVTTETTFDVTCETPGGGGEVVFVSDRDGPVNIYSMMGDGSDVLRVTNGLDLDDRPDLSADGTKIVFRRIVDGNSEIFVMDADGSNIVNLTNHPALDTQPSWSPDASHICFTSTRDESLAIYRMDADGGNVVRLTEDFAFFCDWSPEGDQIAFVSFGVEDSDIFVMNADGSDPVNVSRSLGEDARPAWSPDGSQIAFDRIVSDNFDIFVMDADGSNQENLTDSPTIFDLEPKWLADGSKILFETLSGASIEIFQMNPDGTGQANLTNTPTSNEFTGGFTF